MKQINGLADCEKIQMVNEGNYSVTVTDGGSLVILNINSQTYPAGLTPERARYIAECLIKSALRIETKSSKVKA